VIEEPEYDYDNIIASKIRGEVLELMDELIDLVSTDEQPKAYNLDDEFYGSVLYTLTDIRTNWM